MQTLSLCMIVRDEAPILPHFFTKVQGLWDELCVVDTGSVDGTTDAVRAAGGRLQSFLWNDDFSAARNASLEMASGDWILVLDADEFVSPSLVASARRYIDKTDRGAGLLAFVGATESGAPLRTNQLRIFRRQAGMRYRFRLHEDICDPVQSYLTRTGLGIGHLAGHVSHLGDSPVRQAQKGICDRDRALWQATLAQDPNDLQGWYECVAHALRWAGAQAARQAGELALTALERLPEARLGQEPQAYKLLVAIADSFEQEDAQRAVAILFAKQACIAPHVLYFLRRAELLAKVNQPCAAAADFNRCLDLAHTHYDVHLGCVRPLVGLAKIFAGQGDLDEALQRIHEALRKDCRDPVALAAFADVSLQKNGIPGLTVAAQIYVNQYGECRERQIAFTRRQRAHIMT